MSATQIATVSVSVQIEGLPPGVLFGSKGLMEEEAKPENNSSKKGGSRRTAVEEAPFRAHWMGARGKSNLCIPSVMLYRSFCQAATDFQQPRNKRKNMSTLVGATVAFEQDKIDLGTKDYEVFGDPELGEWVRIPPRTGAMVRIGRPIVRKWSAAFTVLVDDEMWDATMLEEIIKHAGRTVGIGAWRPQLKGPHGRFVVNEFVVGG